MSEFVHMPFHMSLMPYVDDGGNQTWSEALSLLSRRDVYNRVGEVLCGYRVIDTLNNDWRP